MIFQSFLAGEKKHRNTSRPGALLDEEEARLVVNVLWYLCLQRLHLRLSISPLSEKVLEYLNVLRQRLKM